MFDLSRITTMTRAVWALCGVLTLVTAPSCASRDENATNAKVAEISILDSARNFADSFESFPLDLAFRLGEYLNDGVERPANVDAIPYDMFRALYQFVATARRTPVKVYEDAFAALDDLSAREIALTLIASRLRAQTSDVPDAFLRRAQEVYQQYLSDTSETFSASTSDESELNRDLEFRRSFLQFQCLLGERNPFFHSKSHDFDYWLDLLEVATEDELTTILELECDERILKLDLPFSDNLGSAFLELRGFPLEKDANDTIERNEDSRRKLEIMKEFFSPFQGEAYDQRVAIMEKYDALNAFKKCAFLAVDHDKPTPTARNAEEKDAFIRDELAVMKAYLALRRSALVTEVATNRAEVSPNALGDVATRALE